jgi:hypothetical protein
VDLEPPFAAHAPFADPPIPHFTKASKAPKEVVVGSERAVRRHRKGPSPSDALTKAGRPLSLRELTRLSDAKGIANARERKKGIDGAAGEAPIPFTHS